MRSILVGAVLIAAHVAALASAREYVVRGVEEPAPELLARALANDDGLLLLTSPLTTRRAYLAAAAEKTALALQHAGYPDATAAAVIEAGDDGERILIDTTPGPRLLAAGIEITGLADDLAGDLRAWLKSPRPPADAVRQDVDSGDGWSGSRWVDRRGQRAVLAPPLWSRGQPAPCDAHHLRDVRAAIARFLRDHGHFAAARGVEKPQASGPRCEIAVSRNHDDAVLALTFADLPQPAVLRDIEVAPASRTTAATLRETLGIELGTTVTEHDRLAWREALRETGRFVRHEVKFKELKPDADGIGGIVAIFDLAAYPPAPPLGTPLSREEEAMLRCRSWLLTTLADDDDLVAGWTRAGDTAPIGELTISTREGILLTALPDTADTCGLAASGGGLGCFLPHGEGRFEFPMPVRMRAVIDVAFTLDDQVEQGHHRYPRRLAVRAAIDSRPRDASGAIAVTARIEPAACLAFLHEGDATTRWDGDVLVVATAKTELRVEAATGRLLRLTADDGTRFDFESGPGRLAAAVVALRETSGDDGWQDDAPLSSAVRFLSSDAIGVTLERLAAATGFRPLLADIMPVVKAVSRNLRETADRGGFAVADGQLAAALAQAVDDDASALPSIPAMDRGTSPTDPLMTLAAMGSGHAWRWLDRACGSGAWPCGLVRIATLAARHDSTAALWEVTAFMASPDHGPLANLVAANVMPITTMAISFAKQGQTRLSTQAFHADCAAALAVLHDCGLDRCGVSLIRSLDDDEARTAGAAWMHDPDLLLPIVHELRGCESEEAAVAALPSALDRWWDASLRDVVAAALAAKAGTQTAEKPAAESTPRR